MRGSIEFDDHAETPRNFFKTHTPPDMGALAHLLQVDHLLSKVLRTI